MLLGHATLRNLSRYSAYHERTFARWYARDFDLVSLNQAAIIRVIPPAHEQALVIDASFVPQSGKKTSGLDRFWNGRHSRTEKGQAMMSRHTGDLETLHQNEIEIRAALAKPDERRVFGIVVPGFRLRHGGKFQDDYETRQGAGTLQPFHGLPSDQILPTVFRH
jgi:hypothetical protein